MSETTSATERTERTERRSDEEDSTERRSEEDDRRSECSEDEEDPRDKMRKGTGETKFGRVKWFDSRKGYGYVTVTRERKDYFVHHSGILTREDVYKTLLPDEYVQFKICLDDNGRECACDVEGVDGGPIQCETDNMRKVWSQGFRRGRDRGGDGDDRSRGRDRDRGRRRRRDDRSRSRGRRDRSRSPRRDRDRDNRKERRRSNGHRDRSRSRGRRED